MPEVIPPDPQSPTPRPSLSPRHQWLIVLGAAVFVGAAFALSSLWNAGAKPSERPDSAAEHRTPAGMLRLSAAQRASLETQPVVSITFRTEQLTEGKIALNSDKTTPVFSPYSGRVTSVLANLGDRVKRGQPLLAVEAVEFVQGQSDLVNAVNTLGTARSQLALAQTNEERKHALYDAKGASLQDWQQSQSDLVTARSNVRSAEAAVALARNRLRIQGKSDPEIIKLENPERINAASLVLAPISGTVTDRQVGLGQYIQAGAANPVYAVGDLTTVWLIGSVREADASRARRGQAVEASVFALPGRTFKARITYVAPVLDPNTRRLAVRAEVENPEGVLKPEMFASFTIVTGAESDAPAVPQRAIVYEGDEARVWILADGNMVASRQIRTGRTREGMVEVLEGLVSGERVVTRGTLFIDRAARDE